MNRELKFRAWDGQAMRYDVTGFEHGDANEMKGIFLDGRYFRISETPVMQFSGLQDSDGKDIYEGDVLYLAGYGDYEAEFPFLELYQGYPEGDIGKIKGNIFENPELASGNPANPATVPALETSGENTK